MACDLVISESRAVPIPSDNFPRDVGIISRDQLFPAPSSSQRGGEQGSSVISGEWCVREIWSIKIRLGEIYIRSIGPKPCGAGS